MSELNQLPKNWNESSLEDLSISISAGGTPRRNNEEYWNNGTIPWLKISDLHQGIVTESEEFITTKAIEESSAKIFPRGTVLITIFASLGEVALLDIPAATNQAIVGIRVNESKIDKKYLIHFLKYIKSYIESKAQIGTQKNINLGILKKIPIQYGPLKTQKQIVSILDTAETLKKKKQKISELYSKLSTTVFLTIFGHLYNNDKKWNEISLNEICEKITDGEHVTPKRQNDGIMLLSARNVKNSYIDLDADVDYIPETEYERIKKRCNPQYGDILISCSGTIGRVTAVKIKEPFTLVRSVALLKLKKEISPIFLEYFLQSSYAQSQINQLIHQSNQANLFLGQIKSLKIQVPPFEMQEKFAKIVQQIESYNSQNFLSSAQISKLFSSLQHQAFKGELVK